MNILIAVDYFPPNGGGGRSYRMAKLATFLTQQGCNVCVLCSDKTVNPDETMLDGAIKENLEIIRIKQSNSLFVKLVKKLLRQIWIGDGGLFFAWQMYSRLCKRQIPIIPDIVFTSSAPYEVHLLGLWLKKRFGFQWVADFRDPYTLNRNYNKRFPVGRWFDRRFEKRIYQQADGIVFNTIANRQQSIETFKLDESATKYTVCQNGFDPEEVVESNIKKEAVSGLVISYIGGWRDDAYENEFINQILREKEYYKEKSICFRFIGNGTEALSGRAEQSDGVIELVGFVPQTALGQYWASTDGVILLLPPSQGYLGWVPQKLYGYMAQRKAILGIVPQGESESYLKEYGCAVMCRPEEFDLRKMVEQLAPLASEVDADEETVSRFSQLRLFGDLLAWLKGITV